MAFYPGSYTMLSSVSWRMQQKGIVPDVITYTALISALEKGKLPKQVLKIFEEMQEKDAEYQLTQCYDSLEWRTE